MKKIIVELFDIVKTDYWTVAIFASENVCLLYALIILLTLVAAKFSTRCFSKNLFFSSILFACPDYEMCLFPFFN